MGKRYKELKELFGKFWYNNIKTQYKKISVGIGTATNGITTAVIGYVIASAIASGDVALAGLVIGILLPIQGLINALCFHIFGKATNGNGYHVPETKLIVDVVKKDPVLRKFIRDKILEYTRKDSHLLNGFDKKDEDEK